MDQFANNLAASLGDREALHQVLLSLYKRGIVTRKLDFLYFSDYYIPKAFYK